MNTRLAGSFGSALIWKSIQLVGVKVIFLARTLILARLLVPEDFGLLAISMIAVGFLLSITDFGMIPALVQRKNVQDRHYDAAWTVGLLRAIGVSIIVFLGAPIIANLFSEPRAEELIRVIAIRPILEAAVSIKVADLIRNFRFRPLAAIYLAEAIANTVVSIALASILGVWALIAGALVGPFTLTIASYIAAPHRPRLSMNMSAARPLINYGRWIFLTSLISVVGSSMVQLVISRHLGAVELGLYYLAARLAFVPYEISSEVVGSVAFPLYTKIQDNLVQAGKAFRSILSGISAMILPVCALMIALAPSLVKTVLGPQWEGTEPLIRVLVLVSIIDSLGATIVPILKGLGRPDRLVIIEAVQSIVLIIFIWVLIEQFGVMGAVSAWLPATFFAQMVAIYFLRQIIPRPFVGMGVPISVITLVSIMGAVLGLLIDNRIPGLIGLISGTLIAMLAMGLLLYGSDHQLNLGLVKDLIRIFPQVGTFLRMEPVDESI